MTALQKPPKHTGHEGTRRKSLHLQTFVYVVSFVFKDLFAVDSSIQQNKGVDNFAGLLTGFTT
jgi:hypothetical protein